MRRPLALLLVVAFFAGCGHSDPATQAERQLRSCDDGGSGGVVIDGVCL